MDKDKELIEKAAADEKPHHRHREPDSRKRILCIGCGTGQAQLLKGLSEQDYYLSSIVGVTDNGGHSGILRKILGIPPVGDARNCLAALSRNDNAMSRLLKYRFADASMGGISMGNLVLAVLTSTEQKFSRAVNMVRKSIGIPHRIIPVSDQTTDICARLEDEHVIIGEWEIIERIPRKPIVKLFHKDKIQLHPLAEEEISSADYIVISPGSLLTGIISIMLTSGIQDALRRSKAKKIFVCNIMTQPGQTDGLTLAQHAGELLKYLKCSIDCILANNKKPNPRLVALYEKEGSEIVKKGRPTGIKTVTGDFCETLPPKEVTELIKNYNGFEEQGIRRGLHLIRHDPVKTANAIVKIIEKDK